MHAKSVALTVEENETCEADVRGPLTEHYVAAYLRRTWAEGAPRRGSAWIERAKNARFLREIHTTVNSQCV